MMITNKLTSFVLTVAMAFATFSCTEKKELIQDESTAKNIVVNVNGVSFSMIKVEGGSFRMGSDGILFEVVPNEAPSHTVVMSSYYIGETEVTAELWTAVMGNNPCSSESGSMRAPVESVSWDDCQTFIAALNELTGRTFSLPTEAQWEFAARGGIKSGDFLYSGSDKMLNVGWCMDNTTLPRPVKLKDANELGIYDMSGNIAEWCSDWYGMYSGSYQEDPLGHHSGTTHVVRGGNWTSPVSDCRSTARKNFSPEYKSSTIGLRLVMKI